jgi:hypothetical protein
MPAGRKPVISPVLHRTERLMARLQGVVEPWKVRVVVCAVGCTDGVEIFAMWARMDKGVEASHCHLLDD